MFDSLLPHELKHARPPCPSPSLRVCSNSCPLSWWCHPTNSSSVVPFSCIQSFPASRSFLRSQFFTSGGQSTGDSVSASVLQMSIQDWFPLGLTGFISLLSKGLPRVFSNTTVQCSAVKLLSRLRLFATPWTVAYHAPLSTGFSWQEYWSGLPFSSPDTTVQKHQFFGAQFSSWFNSHIHRWLLEKP